MSNHEPTAEANSIERITEALRRFERKLLNRPGRHPVVSDPPRPEHDDDIILNRAIAELAALRAENEAAKREAAYLAEVIFKKHYAKNQDYADGTVKWGLCDTTAGIISQIDNMFAGVAEQLAQSLTESEQLKVELNKSRDNLSGFTYAQIEAQFDRLRAENTRLRIDIAHWKGVAAYADSFSIKGHVDELTQLRASLSTAVDAIVKLHATKSQNLACDYWNREMGYKESDIQDWCEETLAQLRPVMPEKGTL